MSNTALILCGGLGTRLNSVSNGYPKCLMNVNGRPFLSYLLELLNSNNFRDIVLCTGYNHDQVQNQIGFEYKDCSIKYSRETSPLGTGGAIVQASQELESEWFLIMNGDSYCSFDLNAQSLLKIKKSLIFVHKVPDVSRFGTIKFDKQNKVLSFQEKNAKSDPGYINAGIYWLHRSSIDSLIKNTFISMEKEVLPSLLGKLQVVECDKGFIDIGTPISYASANNFFDAQPRRDT
jgi:D-glycero-alpha-D-manno-heptose 1-phosphate guanylyltransferase